MNYAIVEDGVTVNRIVAEPDVAALLGALPDYEGCGIGAPYRPVTELELARQETTDVELDGIELGQLATDLQLGDIEQGQALTDLELMMLEGQGHV